MSAPQAARSWAMPTRGEWLEMCVESMPAAWAAAFIRRLTVLGERLNMRSLGSALLGFRRASA